VLVLLVLLIYTIEIHNLHRQILYTEDQVGLSKAETAKAALHKLNLLIEVIAIHDKITIDNASTILNDYDIIVDGSDNFATRYLVNDTCVSLDKTLIYGSILGFGQVRFFNHRKSKNLRDLFPDSPDPKDVLM
jgi:adenylyltransferase/sulfurtransferase